MRLTLDEIAARWFVRPGDTVLDIGTNRGESAAIYLARGAAKVIGFEPRKEARDRIPDALRADPRFEVLPYALSDHCGVAPIFTPRRKDAASSLSHAFFMQIRRDDSDEGIVEYVDVRRLDSLDLPPAKFWKIDAEGLEVEILKGAERAISTSNPEIVQIEIFLHDQKKYRETLNYINKRFLHMWAIGFTGGERIVLCEINTQNISSPEFHDNLNRTGTPRYFGSRKPIKYWIGAQ